MTEIPVASNHPLAGHTHAFFAWCGLLVSVAVALGLLQVLTGWTPTTTTTAYPIAGVTLPWESFIPVIAIVIYWLMWKISCVRPRTTFYAWLDFLGSAAIGLVVLGAFLSWLPFFRPYYAMLGLPVCPITLTTLLTVFWFLPLAGWDIWKNHVQRARYGRDRLEQGSASSGRPQVQVANLDASPTGFTVLVLPNKPGQEIIWDYRDVPQAPAA